MARRRILRMRQLASASPLLKAEPAAGLRPAFRGLKPAVLWYGAAS